MLVDRNGEAIQNQAIQQNIVNNLSTTSPVSDEGMSNESILSTYNNLSNK